MNVEVSGDKEFMRIDTDDMRVWKSSTNWDKDT